VTSDPEQAAAMLQSPPGWTSANDMDERMRGLHVPGQALAEWYRGWGDALAENTGLAPHCEEAA